MPRSLRGPASRWKPRRRCRLTGPARFGALAAATQVPFVLAGTLDRCRARFGGSLRVGRCDTGVSCAGRRSIYGPGLVPRALRGLASCWQARHRCRLRRQTQHLGTVDRCCAQQKRRTQLAVTHLTSLSSLTSFISFNHSHSLTHSCLLTHSLTLTHSLAHSLTRIHLYTLCEQIKYTWGYPVL